MILPGQMWAKRNVEWEYESWDISEDNESF